jgi:hypothetical protein
LPRNAGIVVLPDRTLEETGSGSTVIDYPAEGVTALTLHETTFLTEGRLQPHSTPIMAPAHCPTRNSEILERTVGADARTRQPSTGHTAQGDDLPEFGVEPVRNLSS